MIFKTTINTEIEINTINDLPKLKILVEVNNLEKPNYSKLARELGVDRRTVKKYYESNNKKEKKPKGSKLDEYNDFNVLEAISIISFLIILILLSTLTLKDLINL